MKDILPKTDVCVHIFQCVQCVALLLLLLLGIVLGHMLLMLCTIHMDIYFY